MKRIALSALLLIAVACNRTEEPQSTVPGNPERGRQLIAQYGCNACHAVPGVEGPQGALGPALNGVMARPTLSNGTVQNTPENLVTFIQNPAALNPSSSMPGLMMPAPDAQDMAAYLATLD
jgi:cytochrome c2